MGIITELSNSFYQGHLYYWNDPNWATSGVSEIVGIAESEDQFRERVMGYCNVMKYDVKKEELVIHKWHTHTIQMTTQPYRNQDVPPFNQRISE